MNKKAISYALLPVFALSVFFSGGSASAGTLEGFFNAMGWKWGHYNMTQDQYVTQTKAMFQEQATILGISVDEVKNAWAEGKSFEQLAHEKGLSKTQLKAKMEEARLAKIKSYLQALVNQGVITQAQADKRYELIKNQVTKEEVKKESKKESKKEFKGKIPAGKGFLKWL